MEWFTEPVWLGNYIVARWAALFLVIGGAAVMFIVFAAITGGIIEAALFVWKRIRF